jgi:hypothetical protein
MFHLHFTTKTLERKGFANIAVTQAYQDCHFKQCPELADFTAMLGHIRRVDIVVNIQQ